MANNNQLTRKKPEELGIPSHAILNFLNGVERSGQELHSFMLLRHGCVAAEGWWSPYASDRPHMLFSLSKSFTSTAVGLAASEGLLSVDDTVISFFSDEIPKEISNNLASMCVKHLLSMSTGHAEDTTGKLHQAGDGNWVRAFLNLPVEHQPGTHFVYNSGATYMLSAIVQKLTGQTVLEYLTSRLFDPLGIENASWEVCPRGINTGGWGLSIKTEDIAKFGQLYLDKGVWKGKRLLPEAWVEEATSSHISNGDGGASDWAQGYGYQFWRCRYGAYRGDGAFGQYCIVMPEQDAVLAITSGLDDMQAVLSLVWEHLLPSMDSKPNLPDNEHMELLDKRLSSLELTPSRLKDHSPVAEQISGKQYRLEVNGNNPWAASVTFEKDKCTVTLYDGRVERTLNCGIGKWILGEIIHPTEPSQEQKLMKIAASGTWMDDNTFKMTWRFIETPFYDTMICHFDGNKLRVETSVNVSFGPKERPAIKGWLKE